MPKKSFHINRFEGGMNTDFAPEDIPNNSLLDALGISVSNIGRITMPGDPIAASGVPSGGGSALTSTAFAAGYGLFSFNSDYAQNDSETATKYLAMAKGSEVNIYDGSAWNAHASVAFNLKSTTADTSNPTELSYYAPNGDLRVCDGIFNNANNYNNNVKLFSRTGAKTYGAGTYSKVNFTTGWGVSEASVEKGFPKDSTGFATNAFLRNVTDAHAGAGDSGDYRSERNHDPEGGTHDSTKHAGWLCSESGNVSASGAKWGFRLNFSESSSKTGTWMPTKDVDYKFYSSIVYEGGQEGHPTILNMMPTLYNLDGADKHEQIKFADRSSSSFYKSYVHGVTSSGTTATVTCNQSHGMSNGDYVIIEGSNDLGQNNFDGIYEISGVSGADFNIDVSQPKYGSGYSSVGTNTYTFSDATCDYNNDPTITHDDDSGSEPKIKAGYLVTGTGIPSTNPAYVGVHTSNTSFELYDTNDGQEISTTGGSVTNGTLTFRTRQVCVTKVGTNKAVYFEPTWKINYQDDPDVYLFGADAIDSTSGGNRRIIGSRIYYSSSDDGHGNLWIMFDADFEKGVRAFGIGEEPVVTDYIAWTDGANIGNNNSAENGIRPVFSTSEGSIWYNPPKFETYESLNGYKHDSKLDAKWKTAVIANGRAYVGNIKRRQFSTFNLKNSALSSGGQAWNSTFANDPTFGDRILKSPVDRFDIFPEEMAIELFGGDDGDSIVKLEVFADRLFVFKKNTLHIINIAKDVEILESSHKGLGLDGGKPCQSCLTKTGIAWINSSGAYHYDGKNIESLTDGKIDSFWKGKRSTHVDQDTVQDAFWLATDIPSIGFDTNSSKLIVNKASIDSADNDDLLIYDMKIKAWTFQNEALNDELRSNFVNYDGMLVYHEQASILKYDDSPHSPGLSALGAGLNLSVYTKPYDFGVPLQRKKIYKVYVTYRCSGATNVQMQYYTNGNTNAKYNFTTDATNPFHGDDGIALDGSIAEFDDTAGIWETAVFKPATSSEANNVKSFGLYIFNDADDGAGDAEAVDESFEINDITIIYRDKSIK